MKTTTYTGTLLDATKGRTSKMGNPSWHLYITCDERPQQRVYRTSANISDAYAIDRSWEGRTVLFTVTQAGRIATIRLAD